MDEIHDRIKQIEDYINMQISEGKKRTEILKELHNVLLYERNEIVLQLNIVQQLINVVMEKM